MREGGGYQVALLVDREQQSQKKKLIELVGPWGPLNTKTIYIIQGSSMPEDYFKEMATALQKRLHIKTLQQISVEEAVSRQHTHTAHIYVTTSIAAEAASLQRLFDAGIPFVPISFSEADDEDYAFHEVPYRPAFRLSQYFRETDADLEKLTEHLGYSQDP